MGQFESLACAFTPQGDPLPAPASGDPARPGHPSECPDAYVRGCVAVPAHHHPTASALIDPYLQGHGLAVSALRASGGGVSGVDLYIRDASLPSFVSQYRRSEEGVTASDRVAFCPNASSVTTPPHWSSPWLCRQTWSPGNGPRVGNGSPLLGKARGQRVKLTHHHLLKMQQLATSA